MSTAETLTRHNERVAAMLADHECVGELLLIGIAMARAIDLDDPPFGAGKKLSLRTFADRVYGGGRYLADLAYPAPAGELRADSRPRWRIADVLRADIRRYRPPVGGGHVTRCGRPMSQKPAGVCGRSAHYQHVRLFTDPLSGEQTWIGACSYAAHKAWWLALKADNAAELARHPAPIPPANTGGVLDRHLPEIDWWAIWRHLDPKWSPPPEGEVWRKPTLTVLVEDEPQPAEALPRPALTVLQGGWR